MKCAHCLTALAAHLPVALQALAWNIELLWRNEAPFALPNMAVDVLGAKTLILRQPRDELERYVDLPSFKSDEYQIQKMALILCHSALPFQTWCAMKRDKYIF